ncbi:hypothetical protein [Desulfomicrobium baculatum]|uniref:WD40 domain protein beta Propeller n=1 Tax=Desulfomicrobium baculatum (strain DSM 4028 / VKM B-1378 / X) TaxID=525897 RepID=C7LX87_DESBD|nr:hypothetical protein [Desulfomicrobium baculatum]ACU88760.1 hypothetical protein Dbac_0637 [Desulfomicrobium baculatum DSM 4028]
MRRSVSSAAAVLALVFCLFALTAGAASDGLSKVPQSRGAADDVLIYERQGWIWSCDGEGGNQKRLIRGARPGSCADGRLIAFFRPSEGKNPEEMSDLWIYDAKSAAERKIASALFAASSPVWSGQGAWVAFLARDARSLTRIVVLAADGSGLRVPLREGDEGAGFLCALSITPQDSLLVHDMSNAYWVDPAGGVLKSVPLEKIMGSLATGVTSSDTFSVCPADETVLVFSHAVRGTARFEKIMHEPSSALSLHDSWVGVGKNMQITPQDVTAFDPVWSRDGKRIYFIGYKDTQAADAELFRVLRVDRFGSGLKELVPGEGVAVGAGSAGAR